MEARKNTRTINNARLDDSEAWTGACKFRFCSATLRTIRYRRLAFGFVAVTSETSEDVYSEMWGRR